MKNQTPSHLAIKFNDFNFPQPISDALDQLGYETPTPVQAQAIPLVLEKRDVLATAQTGTGKTAAFALPLISRMLNGDMRPALIVAPTRELAEQIGMVLEQLTLFCPHIKSAVVIGGTSYPRQIRQLRSNPMFVVGTPGRLLDQVRLGHLKLNTGSSASSFATLVIDEADRLLDMGFEPQMNDVVSHLPNERQSLLFSATMPDEITRLAKKYLREPVRVSIGAVSQPVDKIKQDVIKVTTSSKDQTLVQELDKVAGSILIFTKTKWKTEKLAKFLDGVGHEVGRIHGDRSQTQRSNAIRDFRAGKTRILVATDIAARGLDIPHIEHVVNYDLPMCPEDYIHRIGRTARAGADGHSIAFVTPEETQLWARIHKLIYGKFPDQGYNKPGSYHGKIQGKSHGNRRGGDQGRPHPRNRKVLNEKSKTDRHKFSHKNRLGADQNQPQSSGQNQERNHGRPFTHRAGGADRNSKNPKLNQSHTHRPALSPRRAEEARANRFLEEERRKKTPSNFRPQAKNIRPKVSQQNRR